MITVKLYGNVTTYDTKEEAAEFLLDCMANSDGAEQGRYTDAYLQLMEGKTEVSDDE